MQGVGQGSNTSCLSALERAVLARHHLLPIAPAIPPLEVLVACEPFWDRVSLGIVALGEEEAQQRGVCGVEQVDAHRFGPRAAAATWPALEAHPPHHAHQAMDVAVLRLHRTTAL